MATSYTKYLCLIVIVISVFSCGKDDTYFPVVSEDEPSEIEVDTPQISPVVFDIEAVPYQTLAEYNFFEGMLKDLKPVYGVLPYDVISPLFSDYAHKKRFLWMPSDVKASYVNDYSIVEFPLGTVLIKNFYYDNVTPSGGPKIIETRLQIKKQEGWVFANYVWDEEQTQAEFDLDGSFVPLEFIENDVVKNVNYRIPSAAQCLTCHKSDNDIPQPIGVKPQNLNRTLAYADGTMNQLDKWVDMGYLEPTYPSSIETVVDWEDGSQSLDLRVRSYLDINCAHCHSDERHCDYRPMRFAYHESSDIANLGVCVTADDIFDPSITKIVNPRNSQRSIMFVRISSVAPELRMPLLGRTIRHEEGIALIETWINSLTENCN